MKKTIGLGILGLAALFAAPSAMAQQPVEYVRICDIYGTAWYYIPGTETCVNVYTGVTRTETEIGTVTGQLPLVNRIAGAEAAFETATQGAAIGIATPNPILPTGQAYAIGFNWGTFQGNNAIGGAAALAISDNLIITGGFGIGFGNGGASVGARAGINLSGGTR